MPGNIASLNALNNCQFNIFKSSNFQIILCLIIINSEIFPINVIPNFENLMAILYSEQLFSTEGFSNDYSLMYHVHPPTQIIKTEPQVDVSPTIAEEKMLKHRSFEGFKIKPEKDFLQSRKPVLVNNDCHIVLAAPQESMTELFL